MNKDPDGEWIALIKGACKGIDAPPTRAAWRRRIEMNFDAARMLLKSIGLLCRFKELGARRGLDNAAKLTARI